MQKSVSIVKYASIVYLNTVTVIVLCYDVVNYIAIMKDNHLTTS